MAARVRKVVDEQFYLAEARGGGILRREVWADDRGRVVRYNLAYINPAVCPRDNGRVLGYDSAHGVHHRHYMGRTTAVKLESFEQIEARFQREWLAIARMSAGGRAGAV
jgi:hypothetical protein